MMVLYEGRKVRIGNGGTAPVDARNRYATVLRIASHAVSLGRDGVRVQIEETDPWTCDVTESACVPLTEAQDRLARAHGLPGEFARACYNALGEVSLDEARAAIRKYAAEFSEARESTYA